MATDFLIVSKQQPSLYSYLEQDFATDEGVRVILDRRFGERRRGPAPVDADRRRGDRRARADLDERLTSIGFAVVGEG